MSVKTRSYWERCYGQATEKTREFFTSGHESYLAAFAKEFLPLPSRLLVLGCGGGRNVEYLLHCGYEVIGVDLALSALQLASSKTRTCFVQADIRSLPLANESFDGLFCLHTIDHLSQSDASIALSEILRVLKPQKNALISFDSPDESSPSAELELMQDGTRNYKSSSCEGLIFRPYENQEIADLMGHSLVSLSETDNKSRLAHISKEPKTTLRP